MSRDDEPRSDAPPEARPTGVPRCAWWILVLLCGGLASGCREPIVVDGSSPSGPVTALFAAAAAGDEEVFRQLCSPHAEDLALEAGNLCAVDSESERWEGVREFYGRCKIAGPTEEVDGGALVPVACPDAGRRDRTLGVIRRDGRWYLAPHLWVGPDDPSAVFGRRR